LPTGKRDGWITLNTERIQISEGNPLPKECRQIDKLEHGKNLYRQGALTRWRVQTDKKVKI
jgi:hypothetical protein